MDGYRQLSALDWNRSFLEFRVQTLDELVIHEYEWQGLGVVVGERYLNRTLSIGEELTVRDYLLFE